MSEFETVDAESVDMDEVLECIEDCDLVIAVKMIGGEPFVMSMSDGPINPVAYLAAGERLLALSNMIYQGGSNGKAH